VEDKHSTWLQSTVACEFFSFVRCTYTYTCDVCNKTLRTLQLNALLHTPWVSGLALCHHHTHWCSPIHPTLTLQTFPLQIFVVSTILYTCFLLQGHFNCLGKTKTFTFTTHPLQYKNFVALPVKFNCNFYSQKFSSAWHTSKHCPIQSPMSHLLEYAGVHIFTVFPVWRLLLSALTGREQWDFPSSPACVTGILSSDLLVWPSAEFP
jgi:hypothetical protein